MNCHILLHNNHAVQKTATAMVVEHAFFVEGDIESGAGWYGTTKEASYAFNIMPLGIFAYPGNSGPGRYYDCARPIFTAPEPNFVGAWRRYYP